MVGVRSRFAVFALVLVTLVCSTAQSALINYQGKLTDAGGQPVNATVSMRFSIYDSPEGGSQLWYETQGSVVVTNGIYSVLLGSSEPIPEEVFGGSDRWLGIQVESDSEMLPRQRIASVAYAVNADMVDGKHASELGGGGDGHSLDAADGSPTDAVYVDNEGKVGIGKTDPTQKLDVAGTVRGVSATGNSIRGEMTGGSGSAVYGEATAIGGATNYGGWFRSAGNNGKGVYSEATGISGKAVEGKATATGDWTNYGGWFSAWGNYGAAVHGEANASGDHTTYGGEFVSYSDKGRGVYGEAVSGSETAENYGGYFKANTGNGKGVYGEGNSSGVYGKSSTGYGVYSEGNAHVDGNAHVEGNLTWKMKKGYISVPPAAFQPEEDKSYTNLGYALKWEEFPDFRRDFRTPVFLPHNAIVTKLYLFARAPDNGIIKEGFNQIILRLMRYDFEGNVDEVAAINGVDAPSNGSYGSSYSTAISNAICDNSQYCYYLELDLVYRPEFHGAVIEYEFSEPY